MRLIEPAIEDIVGDLPLVLMELNAADDSIVKKRWLSRMAIP
jgi:hypothetical protein